MPKYRQGKRIKPDKYKTLKEGQVYFFGSTRFHEIGKNKYEIKFDKPVPGKLINVSTKRKESEKSPGKYEIVGDIVVYEPIKNYTHYKRQKLRIYSVTIGCNLFRIYDIL